MYVKLSSSLNLVLVASNPYTNAQPERYFLCQVTPNGCIGQLNSSPEGITQLCNFGTSKDLAAASADLPVATSSISLTDSFLLLNVEPSAA